LLNDSTVGFDIVCQCAEEKIDPINDAIDVRVRLMDLGTESNGIGISEFGGLEKRWLVPLKVSALHPLSPQYIEQC